MRDLLCASDECLGTRPSGKLASCDVVDVSLLFLLLMIVHEMMRSEYWRSRDWIFMKRSYEDEEAF